MLIVHQTAVSVILRTCLMIFVIHRFSLSSILSIEAKFMSGEKKTPDASFSNKDVKNGEDQMSGESG